MLTRSSFNRPQIERKRTVHTPIPEHLRRAASFAKADQMADPVEKESPLRSEAYRRLVAALPCANCGIDDNSQAAHPNTGKAKGMKADDRLCFPLCAVRFNAPGCHYLFDQHELFPRSQRADVERQWAEQTRNQIETMGLWPKNLPKWSK